MKIKKNYKYFIYGLLIILYMIVGILFLNLYINLTKEGYTGCLESGYSSEYCISHS